MNSKYALAAFLFMALFLQAFIPAGFMVSASADEKIIICTAYGEKEISTPAGDQHQKSEKPCVFQFGAASPFTYMPVIAHVAEPLTVYDVIIASVDASYNLTSFNARAPPFLS
ncbi:MAG: hypothetical protein GC136_03140 [Alphaproteobacteria bacterium]|nr:hypothetical protein [Alphaproteobacteria bacterium]